MDATTTRTGTAMTGPAGVMGLQGAELAYRRERIVHDFQAINAAARRRAERRARRDAEAAPGPVPGPVLRWLRVRQHATR